MSIKKAANFAMKMYREEQHTFFQCIRIASDYYSVCSCDVQKELASRSGIGARGRKYKYVVVFRHLPEEKIFCGKSSPEEIIKFEEGFYFVNKPKATTKPMDIVREFERKRDGKMRTYNVYCEVFQNKNDADNFYKKKVHERNNMFVSGYQPDYKEPTEDIKNNLFGDLIDELVIRNKPTTFEQNGTF